MESIQNCRLCSGEGRDAALLISPCDCEGEEKYIHANCLSAVLQSDPDWVKMTCPSCNAKYCGGKAMQVIHEHFEANIHTVDQEERGKLFFNLGVGWAKGRESLDNALHFLMTAKLIQESVHGAESDEVASTLLEVGSIYAVAGQYRGAIDSCEGALKIIKQNGGDSSTMLRTLQILGNCYCGAKDPLKAIEVLQQARELAKSENIVGGLDLAKAVMGMAKSKALLDDEEACYDLMVEGLKMLENEDTFETIRALLSLAELCKSLGKADPEKFQEQIRHLERAVKLLKERTKNDPGGFDNLTQVMFMLAQAYIDKADDCTPKDQKEMLVKTCEVYERMLKIDGIKRRTLILIGLAKTYKKTGYNAKSEETVAHLRNIVEGCKTAVKEFQTPNTYTCDICSKGFPKGSTMFGCRECNCDACPGCHNGASLFGKYALSKFVPQFQEQNLETCQFDKIGEDVLSEMGFKKAHLKRWKKMIRYLFDPDKDGIRGVWHPGLVQITESTT